MMRKDIGRVRRRGRPPVRTVGAPARPRSSETRRAHLLDAAAKLFVERDAAEVTIDDIAAEAGVAKGTFYHYFATKADLLGGLQHRFIDAFDRRLETAVGAHAPGDWNGKLVAWVEATITALFEMQALHDVAFHQVPSHGAPQFAQLPFVTRLAELLAGGEDAGAWRVGDPLAVALMVFHGLHGVADETAIARSMDAQSLRALCVQLVCGMVGSAPAER